MGSSLFSYCSSSSPSSKTKRDWMQVFAVYGIGDLKSLIFLLFKAAIFGSISTLSIHYSTQIISFLSDVADVYFPIHIIRFFILFSTLASGVTAIYLLFVAANVFDSSLGLHWTMCQRVVSSVPDWSGVRTVLDVGCGRGILLNSVALQLKRVGSSGRVVGLDHRKETVVTALRTAGVEGVQEYVTCREGEARQLPFLDGYFDAVVSAIHISAIGKDGTAPERKLTWKAKREKALMEMARVLRPGGTGVIWDLVFVPEYAKKLEEMGMEEIKVSERIRAYMVGSHIVSFRKPREGAGRFVDKEEVAMDGQEQPSFLHRRVNHISQCRHMDETDRYKEN